jgi:hypothetical protein
MPTSRERRWILPKRRVGTIGRMNESKMIRSETRGNKGMEENTRNTQVMVKHVNNQWTKGGLVQMSWEKSTSVLKVVCADSKLLE